MKGCSLMLATVCLFCLTFQQSSGNEIGEVLRETPRESPPEEDAPDDISMRFGSSESSDWNNPQNPFLDDDNNVSRKIEFDF